MQVLLYGGGIDSSALLHYLCARGEDVHALFVRYGQKAEALEEQACRHFCEDRQVPLTIVDLPINQLSNSAIMGHVGQVANDPKINIVDGRNFALISMAGMLAAKIGATKVAMGYHVEPVARPFPDASIEFVHAINRMIPYAYVHQFQVVAPFAEWTREQIFAYAKEYCPQVLERAHTCYENVPGGCGECSHCKLKSQIMESL
jgi:7-cyano-7-deazaguanine synthase